jgi:hypothetical protein
MTFELFGCGAIACAWIAHLNKHYPDASFLCYAHPDHATTLGAVATNGLVVQGVLEGTVNGIAIASNVCELVERCTYIFVTVPWNERRIEDFAGPDWSDTTIIVVSGNRFSLAWSARMPSSRPVIVEVPLAPFIARMNNTNTVNIADGKLLMELCVPRSSCLEPAKKEVLRTFFPVYSNFLTIAEGICLDTAGAIHVVGVLHNLDKMGTENLPFYPLAANFMSEILDIDQVRCSVMKKIVGYSITDYRTCMRYYVQDTFDEGNIDKAANFYRTFPKYQRVYLPTKFDRFMFEGVKSLRLLQALAHVLGVPCKPLELILQEATKVMNQSVRTDDEVLAELGLAGLDGLALSLKLKSF